MRLEKISAELVLATMNHDEIIALANTHPVEIAQPDTWVKNVLKHKALALIQQCDYWRNQNEEWRQQAQAELLRGRRNDAITLAHYYQINIARIAALNAELSRREKMVATGVLTGTTLELLIKLQKRKQEGVHIVYCGEVEGDAETLLTLGSGVCAASCTAF